LKRTLVEFEGGLVETYQDFAIRKVDLDFKDSFRGLELTVSGGEDVVVIVTNTACLMHSVHTWNFVRDTANTNICTNWERNM
jgi:hypothetical protein